MADIPTQLPRLLTIDELAAYTGVPKDTLERWRATKSGPAFYKLGRTIRYPESQVLERMESTLRNGDAA